MTRWKHVWSRGDHWRVRPLKMERGTGESGGGRSTRELRVSMSWDITERGITVTVRVSMSRDIMSR